MQFECTRFEANADAVTNQAQPKDEDNPNVLASSLNQANVSGHVVNMIKRLSSLLALEEREIMQRVGCLQVWAGEAKKRSTYKKPVRKQDGDNNLRFADCSPEIQEGLRKSRAAEWQRWRKLNAGVRLTNDEVDKLIQEGVQAHPMQWVETDGTAHKRRQTGKHGYEEVPPLLKSRSVGCGHFEDTIGIRTDSPTADADSHNMVFSWCATKKTFARTADITNAYLQGMPMDSIFLYRVPKG